MDWVHVLNWDSSLSCWVVGAQLQVRTVAAPELTTEAGNNQFQLADDALREITDWVLDHLEGAALPAELAMYLPVPQLH
jgi:hypothetical protein